MAASGALLLCASCEIPLVPIPLPLKLEMSSALEDGDLGVVEDGSAGWNRRVPGIVAQSVVVERPSRRCGTVFVQYGPTLADAFAEETDYNCYGVIRLRRSKPGGMQLLAFQHELGHAFGFPHSEDPRSIMHEKVGSLTVITDEDAEKAASQLAAR